MAALLVMGSIDGWALTSDLSMEYELAGYKAKALYDLTSNDAGVMPESGDLRFRDGGWGLFDFGAGNRSADINIAVNATDVLVCQFADTQGRGVTINSISSCTKSETLNDGSHLFFVADEDAEKLTINIGRGGCLVSVLVMERDAEAETTNFEIKYVLSGSVVKTVSGEAIVGGTVPTEASFFEEDVKYFREDGEPENIDIVAGDNVNEISVRLAEVWSWTVNCVIRDVDFTFSTMAGSVFEGEQVSVPYPKYFSDLDGLLYKKDATNKEYNYKFTPAEDAEVHAIEYDEVDGVDHVIYCSEGEDIDGLTPITSGNTTIRSSNSSSAYAKQDTRIVTLAPGTYKIHAIIYDATSSPDSHWIFMAGDTKVADLNCTVVNIQELESDEFVLEEESDLILAAAGANNKGLDALYIVSVDGEIVEDPTEVTVTIPAGKSFATFASKYAVDLTGTGLTAYVAEVDAETMTATMTPIVKIPANTGVLVKGATSNVDVIKTNDAEEVVKNDFVAVLKATIAPENAYILSTVGDVQGFYKANGNAIEAGHAYLEVVASEARINMLFGETTDILGVKNVVSENSEIFNLAGQRVAKAQKGLYILNGKKVIRN